MSTAYGPHRRMNTDASATFPPRSITVCAALRPARPPPITIVCIFRQMSQKRWVRTVQSGLYSALPGQKKKDQPRNTHTRHNTPAAIRSSSCGQQPPQSECMPAAYPAPCRPIPHGSDQGHGHSLSAASASFAACQIVRHWHSKVTPRRWSFGSDDSETGPGPGRLPRRARDCRS